MVVERRQLYVDQPKVNCCKFRNFITQKHAFILKSENIIALVTDQNIDKNGDNCIDGDQKEVDYGLLKYKEIDFENKTCDGDNES